jgi:hypothetical protein
MAESPDYKELLQLLNEFEVESYGRFFVADMFAARSSAVGHL